MKIVYRAVYMTAVATFALETLREISPVGSGDDPHIGLYRDSHTLFLNGHVVDDLSAWRPGDEVEISNPVPYSRLIELGILRMRVPGSDHVYQHAEMAVRARFGSVVDVSFTFMPVRITNEAVRRRLARREAKDRDRGASLQQQPALILRSK